MTGGSNLEQPHPDDQGQSAAETILKPLPYGFVQVAAMSDAALEAPVWHDGSDRRQGGLLSGEIRLTIEALTPLLVGNDQYALSDANPTVRGAWGVERNAQPWKKKVLEPLRLPDGRVVIPGTALKGMLRQSLGALLGASMERVAERKYTYRPNLGFVPHQLVRREARVAVVQHWSAERTIILLMPKRASKSSVFATDDAVLNLGLSKERLASATNGVRVIGRKSGVQKSKDRTSKPYRLEGTRGCSELFDHVAFSYVGGTDGDGTLAREFNKGYVYGCVMVERRDFDRAKKVDVPDEVVQQYEETTRRLTDRVHGHLRTVHPLVRRLTEKGLINSLQENIRNAAERAKTPGTLVFVEVELADDGSVARVCSIGHNFLYRWAYTGTVRTIEPRQPRPEVTPLAAEREVDEAGRPRRLSGARLLFGYVASDGCHEPASGIGRDAHRQLAGRLAFNAAVEQVAPGVTPALRFLRPEAGFTVPLKILGMPRPSAVEAYVDQSRLATRSNGPGGDRGTLVTYGDVPGERSGDLNGRKFYLHQPDARTDALVYTDKAQIPSDQAMLARYVSVPGATFRATLRFRDLRPWELGAVLAALEPERVFRAWDAVGRVPTGEPWDDIETHVKADGADPLFASKLGHGRPIGMGSVRIAVDGVSLVGDDGGLATAPGDRVNEIAAAFTHGDERLLALDGRTVLAWLDVHRYRGRTRTPYPTASDKGRPPTIYDYHTGHRRAHASGRRTRP
jgi:CRISPR-associated protein (TIGR03986 family)